VIGEEWNMGQKDEVRIIILFFGIHLDLQYLRIEK